MRSKSLRLFVLAHSDETVARVPVHPHITPVDLRALDLEERWRSNQFAETRFLLSPESADVDAEFVGMASVRFRDKWPDEPPLEFIAERLPHSRLLRPSTGLAPSLTEGNWIDESDAFHPGMGEILDNLIASHGLHLDFHSVPLSNTFICSREAFMGLRTFMAEHLTELVDKYGFEMPFEYRCRECGTTNPGGLGRYGEERHVGFLAERLTMLYFAQRRDISFLPPRALMLRGLAEYRATEALRNLRTRFLAERRSRMDALEEATP